MVTGGGGRWPRRFLLVSAGYLLSWRVGALVGVPVRAEVTVALLGFVFHTVFGMGYLLIPSYFERVLDATWPPAVHLGLTGFGTATLAAASIREGPRLLEPLGAAAWTLGVAVFLATILWTVRDNLTGGETGTAAGKREFRWVDRYANPFVLVSLGYVLIGTWELLAGTTPLPGLTDGYAPRVTHLLAGGGATLLLLALGARLAPRFLGVPAPRRVVGVVLPAGALGPALLANGLGGGLSLVVGALAEATAVVGFAGLYARSFVRSERRTVGLTAVLGGLTCGVTGVVIGLSFAFGGIATERIVAHRQLMLLGFLGVTIVGFAMQFFPPTAGRFRGANDASAWLGVAALCGGLVWIVAGTLGGVHVAVTVGHALALAGAVVYSYLIVRSLRTVASR
ncbi:hypothetical protein GRX01_12970 [Halobaculum sp. WSA2]|uniref:Uncharacterized protein n=1 Tax=Halobaculum saliterrae TaxID=2073113 RepID=A0A6B0SXI2_9EURY|nr:hypothetical protein [Halobaculum saliterrae]MXR42246.1 hypothetical protein [Halobaculum saliterrae]